MRVALQAGKMILVVLTAMAGKILGLREKG
jgi:hypothetical protein